jgi:hypothetical protein
MEAKLHMRKSENHEMDGMRLLRLVALWFASCLRLSEVVNGHLLLTLRCKLPKKEKYKLIRVHYYS